MCIFHLCSIFHLLKICMSSLNILFICILCFHEKRPKNLFSPYGKKSFHSYYQESTSNKTTLHPYINNKPICWLVL